MGNLYPLMYYNMGNLKQQVPYYFVLYLNMDDLRERKLIV